MRNLLLLLMTLLFLVASIAVSGPGNRTPFTVAQPDGSQLTLRVLGDEWYSRCETVDGYTVIRRSDNWWMYAQRSADGTLVPSNVVARSEANRTSDELSFLVQTGKHLQPAKAVLEELLSRNPNRFAVNRAITSRLLKASSDTVTWKVLVLLIDFPDLAHQSGHDIQAFDDMFNQQGWEGGIGSTGSFNDYYREVSYGKFGVHADVHGWYMASQNLSYYAWSGASHWSRARELAKDAVDQAEAAGVDFSQYDNDGDGKVESVIIVHAGPGASQNSNYDYIWTHKYSLSSTVVYDGVQISAYTMNEELEYDRHSGIGNYAHEYGHALALPDLYDIDGTSEGVGEWCVMSGGAWLNWARTPPHFCVWAKEFMGWVSPTVLSSNGQVSFPAIESDENAFYRVNIQGKTNEYFLLENRQNQMYDTYLPGNGLLIWHIDDSKTTNADENHKRVDLEEADGLDGLDKGTNRGDAGDPYPGTSGNTVFDTYSYPSSKAYNNSLTYLSVSNISNSATTMTAEITLDGAAYFSSNVKTGHAPLTVNFTDMSVASTAVNAWEWDFQNDGTVDATTQNPSFTFAQPGRYSVKLVASNGTSTYSSVDQNAVKVFNGTSSIYFDDPSYSYTVPASSTLNPTDYLTFEVWIKPTDWGTTASGEGYLVDKSYLYSFIQKTPTTDYYQQSLVFAIKDNANIIAKWCTPANSISLNAWQHIAVTYNGATQEMKIYINGVNQTLKRTGTPSAKIKDNSTKPLYIGNSGTLSKAFVGSIDEMRFWGIVKTDQAIQADMGRYLPSTETGLLLAYYKMDEGNGTSLLDSSPNHNNATGNSSWDDGKVLTGAADKVADENSILPASYELMANYPNPFNPSTKIRFGLPVEANVTIKIFSILGQQVTELVKKKLVAGYHEVGFDASTLSSGIYLYSIDAKGNDGSSFFGTKKMILLR